MFSGGIRGAACLALPLFMSAASACAPAESSSSDIANTGGDSSCQGDTCPHLEPGSSGGATSEAAGGSGGTLPEGGTGGGCSGDDCTPCDGCLVLGACYEPGEASLSNSCEVCRPSLTTTSLSPVEGNPS